LANALPHGSFGIKAKRSFLLGKHSKSLCFIASSMFFTIFTLDLPL